MSGLLQVCHIYDMLHVLGKFLYSTSIVVWYFFRDLSFDSLLYCICGFENDVYICMFKEILKLSDSWAVVCKCCPFFVFFVLLFLCHLCAVFVFSLAMWLFGKLLFCAMDCIVSHSVCRLSSVSRSDSFLLI